MTMTTETIDALNVANTATKETLRIHDIIPRTKETRKTELEWLVNSSKINAFFSFVPSEKRPHLLRWAYSYRDFSIIALDLLPEEIEKVRANFDTWKKVLEAFLFIHNHISEDFYPNITFSPVIINGDWKAGSCIVLFKGKTESGKTPEGYKKLKSFCLNISTKTNDNLNETNPNDKNESEPFPITKEERIFTEILEMLEGEYISVRKIFALGMKQWQSRLIYSKISELWLFEIDRENQNLKTYFKEKFGLLTIETIAEILLMENPED